MVKPLIIGQAPARGSTMPFVGQSGRRLARLAGLDLEELHRRVEMTNILEEWPGRTGKGDDFPMALAREKAAALIQRLERQEPRRILLMGRKVKRAMGANVYEYFQWWPFDQHNAMIFPHPSGVNHLWNEAGTHMLARHVMEKELWLPPE